MELTWTTADNKKYHCPCGSTMSRRCQKARDTLERSGSSSRRPSRSKTACNECAASRLKCDSQTPCAGCRKKSLKCEYTRKGYSDPYKVFRIPTATPAVEHAAEPSPQQAQNTIMESGASVLPTPPGNNATSAPEQSGVLEFSGFDFNTPLESTSAGFISDPGSASMNDAFFDLDWDSLLTNLDWPENVVSANNAAATASELTEPSAVPKDSGWNFTKGLQLRQIDSVEAKCIEIQAYIGAFQTGIDHTILSKYLTRDRVVDCVQLYAKCFQSIHPILHLPTFDLTKTPPDLLAAMVLIGACYSSTIIPPTTVVQGAIHMLLVLECSSHERAMSAPPLESIQATALLCQLLILTQNPQAYYFATMHRGRTISMAERAGLFYNGDTTNQWNLNDNSFDWHLWSQLEMRKRLAHHIFVDDVGGSMFTRSSSHISPFTFYVDTPCYNDCWVAPTANECLEKLRVAPPSIQVATAVKRLRSASPLQGHHIFDASDCGMLEIIVALHSVLFRTMEESLDDENNVPLDDANSNSSNQSTEVNFSDLLNRDLLNYDIANIASRIVGKYGSPTIRRVDDALDAWLKNWNARRVRDMYDERHGAFTHPLNFWLLAKLFLVLHFFRNRYQGQVPGMDENGQPRDSELHAFYNNNGAAQGRLAIQMQVIGWLSKLRRQREGNLLSGGSFLSEVLNMQ
ncbi:hypothetical protein V494_06721 [Pseudogymnoascus sp. VKM F-4513 (FW-928)]|nr:hypothetical protein V494_06721 [Pseudogymnoascus sp. VKM F-4513 (FW-928)]